MIIIKQQNLQIDFAFRDKLRNIGMYYEGKKNNNLNMHFKYPKNKQHLMWHLE